MISETVLLILILIFIVCIFYNLKFDNFNKVYTNTDKYIFSKIILDNKLYLIFPVYDKEINVNDFKIELHDIKLSLINEIKKIENEPIHIFIYKLNEKLDSTDIVTGYFKYNNYIDNLILYPQFTNQKNDLAITTLFKDDYYLFPLFYKYYKNQGVSLFIMYYNGISDNNIKNLFNYNDVILIDWNFRYWNKDVLYKHHAQIGQLHDALYRYAKPLSKFIIYCDLDEYLHIPNTKLLNFIQKNPDLDIIEFNNYFSETLDKKIPDEIPKKIKIGKKYNYTVRSKNIYKTSSIYSINIHFPYKIVDNPKISKDHMMFHFQSWSNRFPEQLDTIYTLI